MCHYALLQSEECQRLLHLVEVKGSAVELLDVMLEEISPQTVNVAKVSIHPNFIQW